MSATFSYTFILPRVGNPTVATLVGFGTNFFRTSFDDAVLGGLPENCETVTRCARAFTAERVGLFHTSSDMLPIRKHEQEENKDSNTRTCRCSLLRKLGFAIASKMITAKSL